MCNRLLVAGLLAAASLVTAPIFAQPLGGTYSCANGNPGGAFDYADIGDFFNDLETFGMNAPVTLDLYDVGGDFTSKESYQLGIDGIDPTSPILRPVSGISASNTLTIRAAQGQSPVVKGKGAMAIYPAVGPWSRGGMSFSGIGHTSIKGLEIHSADFGISFSNYNSYSADNIRVAGCRFHGIAQSSAIGTWSWSGPFHNLTIEGNMFWDCNGPDSGQGSWGVICVNEGGPNVVIRNNTVLLIQTAGGAYTGIFYRHYTAGGSLAELVGNIIYVDHVSNVAAYNGFHPVLADGNVFHVKGAARLFSGTGDWAWWQGLGHDLNGLNADPLFMNVTPGQTDPRLRPDSPAIDLIPASALTTDVFGNPRPYGSGYDAGAHEVQNHGARADAAAVSAFSGGTYGPFDLTVDYGDVLSDARIELTDPEADTITVLSITSQTPTTAISAPVVPASGHPLVLEWTGAATDPPGTYTWTVEYADAGNGFALTCDVNITINPPPPIAITTLSLPVGIEGSAYDETIQTAAATGAVTFSLQSGTLPPGLSLDAGTGTISGTPTQDGLFNFTIQAADSFSTAAQAYDLHIHPPPPPLVFATLSLPNGRVGAPYSEAIQATGGVGTITISLTAGTLPIGIGFTAGSLTGTPTQHGDFPLTFEAQDQATATTQIQLQLTIDQAPTPPSQEGTSGSGSGGCSQRSSQGTSALWLLATLAATQALRRRSQRRDGAGH